MMKNKLFYDAITSMGIEETNIWGVTGETSVPGTTQTVNPTPINAVFVGFIKKLPFSVPRNHILILTNGRAGDDLPASEAGLSIRIYADQINGANTFSTDLALSRNIQIRLEPPLIIPENYIVGIGLVNRHAGTANISWLLSGYLARLTTSGRPAIGEK